MKSNHGIYYEMIRFQPFLFFWLFSMFVFLNVCFFSPYFNEKFFSTLRIYVLIRIFSNIHYVTLHSHIIVRFHLISCSFTCFKYAILPESSVRLKSVLFLRCRKLILYLTSRWITVCIVERWLGEVRHGALLNSRCHANA